jgi:hypothetical protein
VKQAFKLSIAGLALVILFFTSGCKKNKSPGTQFTIQIDSIIHPDTIAVGDVLEIKFYGLIGNTKCYSFLKFDVSFDADKIYTTGIGVNSESENCAESQVFLTGKDLNIYELPEGDFTILVNQQRGNTLESTVHVVQ